LGFKLQVMRRVLSLVLLTACASASPIVAPPPNTNLGGCTLFPANNIWNASVANLPVDKNSSAYISSIGAGTGLHADFGSGLYQGAPIGIGYVVVPANQVGVSISQFLYDDESDHGLYPIPSNAPIEGGANSSGDRHVLVVREGECKLYEVGNAYPNTDGSWRVGAGAIWDLKSNALRPKTWTSADAAGLPILPGLVRHDEVAAGVIAHAIRFTADVTQKAFIWPARHQAGSSSATTVPPMGARFRLKANVEISSYPKDVRVILQAFKTYGIILADNGSNWYISGTQDEAWDNDLLQNLSKVKGSDFEAVDSSSLTVDSDSGQVK
jgi:hypothetical protein